MALPNALVGFASPIVETALKTGARGSSTTVTDYGVIGDAFFKKAQLDLGIAELKGNMAMKSAQMIADINQDNARMDLSMVQKKMDYDLSLRQLRQELKAEEVSTFEAVMGSISGAATGAAGGFMVGGPIGAVVGGVAGGGLTAAGYATSGRKGGQAAQQMIGNVANLAVAIKGSAQESKASDVVATGLKTAEGLMATINDMNAPAEKRLEAMGKLDALTSSVQSQVFDITGNMESSMKTASGFRNLIMGQGGADGKGSGRAWEMANLQTAVKAKSDPRFDDPELAGQARQEYVDQMRANFASQFGADKEMNPDLLASVVRQSGINKRRGIMEIDNPKIDVAAGPADQWGNLPTVPAAGSAPRQSNRVQGVSRLNPVIDSPQDGPSISQPAPSRTPPVQRRFATSGATQPSGPGLIMDDGGPPITSPQAVAPLQKIGEQSAEVVKELEKQKQEKLKERSLGDKVRDFAFGDSPLGMLSSDEKKEANKIDKQIDQVKDEQEDEEAHSRMVKAERAANQREEMIFDQRQRRAMEQRAAANPGVKEARNAERAKLDEVAPKLDDLPEKDVTQRNRKQGLRDAVAAAQHLDDVMEKIPDDLMARFSEFIEAEGIGVKSPHMSVEALDEIGKALSDKTAEKHFTRKERDLLDEYRMELYNLTYADALMDAGPGGVKNEQLRMGKQNMPGFSDDYRKRSNKLRLLMRGYQERISDAVKSGGSAREEEQIDLRLKKQQLRNAEIEGQNKLIRRSNSLIKKDDEESASEKMIKYWVDID